MNFPHQTHTMSESSGSSWSPFLVPQSPGCNSQDLCSNKIDISETLSIKQLKCWVQGTKTFISLSTHNWRIKFFWCLLKVKQKREWHQKRMWAYKNEEERMKNYILFKLHSLPTSHLLRATETKGTLQWRKDKGRIQDKIKTEQKGRSMGRKWGCIFPSLVMITSGGL